MQIGGEDDCETYVMKNAIEGATTGGHNSNKQSMSRSYTDIGDRRDKKRLSKVPGLDFSNLKQVKDFKDWYSYAKKLEDAIRLLRESIQNYEKENT